MKSESNYRGFSLIELSVVLVVTGLLVVGIIVGAELVFDAKIRLLVGEIRNYQTAVRVFYTSNDRLPGDKSKKGRIDNGGLNYADNSFPSPYDASPNKPTPEGGAFVDLFLEGLINFEPINVGNRTIGEAFPISKPFEEWYYMAAYIPSSSKNPKGIVNVGNVLVFSATDSPTANTLTKLKLFQQIDAKIDDGRSNGGNLRAYCAGVRTPPYDNVSYDDAEVAAINNPKGDYGCSVLYIKVGSKGKL